MMYVNPYAHKFYLPFLDLHPHQQVQMAFLSLQILQPVCIKPWINNENLPYIKLSTI